MITSKVKLERKTEHNEHYTGHLPENDKGIIS